MSYGLPVVSSNATCLPEVYGDAAVYFNPLDVDDMAAKISEVLDNKSLREDLRRRGLARVKDFSWERMAKETLEVYKKALKP
jgi:glycosyltransferase involved in cell wall biosynthesis